MSRRAAVILALALGGCAGSTPAVVHYDLAGPARAATRPTLSAAPVVALERLTAAAPYDSDRIALRTSRVHLEHYRYHRWVAPAPDLVTELIAAGWRRSGRFARVEVDAFATDAAVIVEGRLLTLEIDATQPRLAVHVVLELTAREPGGDVLYHQQFERRVPLATRSVGAAVDAMRRGIDAIARAAAAAIARTAGDQVSSRRASCCRRSSSS